MVKRFLTESFLGYYFLIESVCGEYVSEEHREEIFYSLADIFCLGRDGDTERLFEHTCLDWVRRMQDKASYERFCRILEFASRNGQETGETDVDRIVLAGKRMAMNAKGTVFGKESRYTENGVLKLLNESAADGSVFALGILAYMEYNGIFMTPSQTQAKKHVKLCARWNDVFGNLLGIHCDPENAESYYGRLKAVLRHINRTDVFEGICRYNGYTFNGERDKAACILNKAFATGTANKEQSNRAVSDILFSEIISLNDKERALTGGFKELSAELVGLPLDAVSRKAVFDTGCVDTVPLDRGEESSCIASNIDFMFAIPDEAVRPVMIVYSDGFVGDMYAEMVRNGMGASSCVELDASTFTEIDLSHSSENIFLRSIADTENTDTVFIIKNCQHLGDDVLDELCKLFDYGYRKSYNSVRPSATLDLSGLKFVLFAEDGSRQVKLLSELCDTVVAKRLRKEEKVMAADRIFKMRTSEFGMDSITADSDCFEFLSRCDLDRARSIVDSVIKKAFKDKKTHICLDDVQNAYNSRGLADSVQDFGFGGGIKNHA